MNEDAADDAASAQRVEQAVCAAARALAEDLRRAQGSTSDWADAQVAFPLIAEALDGCLTQLAATRCWGPANQLPSSRLWQIAGQWLEVGSLQRHARQKPRGYAGDFEMLAKICQRYCCPHPLGRLFDRYFQQQAAPEAVRNRTQLIADQIVQALRRSASNRLNVVSLGAGPAIDVRRALQQLEPGERGQIHVTLMDMDPLALQMAQAALAQWLPCDQLSVVRENLFRLPQRADSAWGPVSSADFISCPGLLDYLNEQDAAALLRTCWRRLAPHGKLLVFNFARNNPSRAYMEWVGNWYLTYRDHSEIVRLAERAGLPQDCRQVAAEPRNVNLFLAATRDAEAVSDSKP